MRTRDLAGLRRATWEPVQLNRPIATRIMCCGLGLVFLPNALVSVVDVVRSSP